jgi:hypothetical protein
VSTKALIVIEEVDVLADMVDVHFEPQRSSQIRGS